MNVCLQHISTFSLSQKGKVLAFCLGEKTKAKQTLFNAKFLAIPEFCVNTHTLSLSLSL